MHILVLLTLSSKSSTAKDADYRGQDGRLIVVEPHSKSRHQQILGMQYATLGTDAASCRIKGLILSIVSVLNCCCRRVVV